MAYTAPLTVVTGDLATAAQYNTYTKDNLTNIASRCALAHVVHAGICGSNPVGASFWSARHIYPPARTDAPTAATRHLSRQAHEHARDPA